MKFTRFTSSLLLSSTLIAISFNSVCYAANEKQKEKQAIFTPSAPEPVASIQASAFDYSKIKNTKEKKQIFFDTLRPIIKNKNQAINNTRQRVLFAKEHNTDQQWIKTIADKYSVKWDENKPDWDNLLSHIDIIPAELAMTQAANESAWGLSRFAQKGNNIFGQWCYKKGCGIIPSKRDKGSKHEVRKFKSINDSVASYMHNINTGRVYAGLRKLRVSQRAKGEILDAIKLAVGLEKYSTRRKAYVKEIQSMIRTNLRLMQGRK